MQQELTRPRGSGNTRELKSNPLIMLVDEVSRLQGRFKSLFAAVHAQTGLRAMEDLVLNAIAEADWSPTVPQIGRSLGHPRQVIQRAVNDLVDGGYLKPLPNPDHKRAPLFELTARGRELKARSDSQALQLADAFLEHTDARECEVLARELKSVRKAIEAFSRERRGET